MKVHAYERAWMWASLVLVVAFALAILLTAVGMHAHPPSHVEMIDPRHVADDPRFAHPGVETTSEGARVVVVARMWSFTPSEIHVPAHRPVTFRLTSGDVIHGFEVAGTNVNTMVVPGYVSQLTTTFPHPGEYLMVCNEYCGVGHHVMSGRLVVEDQP